jgi:acyl carrier protein
MDIEAAPTTVLCGQCKHLISWFLKHFESEPDTRWISPSTTFHELSIESLDYVEWIIEAEQVFGVEIPNRDSASFATVGDYLRYIGQRTHEGIVPSDNWHLGTLGDPEADRK